MTRKPKSKSTIDGNPGKREYSAAKGRLLTEVPAVPNGLKGVGADLWKSVAEQLVAMKVLCDVDLAALRVMCDAWADYHAASKIANDPKRCYFTTDKGYIVEHPAVRRKQSAAATLQKIWAKFGLTPQAREQIDVDLGAAEAEEEIGRR